MAAVVGGRPVSNQEFQQYFAYSLHFYGWLYGPDSVQPFGCRVARTSASCARLREQVLARLIEERVVLAYAQRRHIALQPQDQLIIARELHTLTAASPSPSQLHVTSSFLRAMLTRELLIRRVEDAVAPPRDKAGPSLHLRKFLLPFSGPNHHSLYRRAVDLATSGRDAPAGAETREEWVAAFRLDGDLKAALLAARAGQFVGPVSRHSGYLVVEVLGRGDHAYGRPARTVLETASFHTWLRRQLHGASLRCYDSRGLPTSCPAEIMKLA